MSIIAAPPTGQTPHKSAVSTGVADVKTITKPEYAEGMYLCAKTIAARVTFDGSTPDPAVQNGQVIPAGGLPVFFPFAVSTKHCSDVAGNSELDVLFVS